MAKTANSLFPTFSSALKSIFHFTAKRTVIFGMTLGVIVFIAGYFPSQIMYAKLISNGATACKITSGLRLCAAASGVSLSVTDGLAIKVTLKNITPIAQSTADLSPGSCNDPNIEINGSDSVSGAFQVCSGDNGDLDFNDKSQIGPFASIANDVKIDVSDLKEGSNTLILKWNDNKQTSGPLTITLKPKTSADKAKLKSCVGEQTEQPYCSSLTITFKDAYYNQDTKCSELGSYIKSLGLKPIPKYCDLADLGVAAVYVPKEDLNTWVSKIKQLPEIKNVTINY